MIYRYECRCCGKLFKTKDVGCHFCSEECHEHDMKKLRVFLSVMNLKIECKRTVLHESHLAEKQEAARAAGMSYGRYVALQRMGAMK